MLCANRTVWVVGLALVVGAGLCLSIGCDSGTGYEGGERAAVSGTITLDGSPVVYGTLTFVPTGGGKRANGAIQDGSYSIPEEQGPNLGPYEVQILGFDAPPKRGEVTVNEDGEEEDETEDEDEESESEDTLGKQIVPRKYNYETTLTVEIASGENTHDFALTAD